MSTTNPNSNWVNLRGFWITNVVVIFLIRFVFSIVPWISNNWGWTLTVLVYNISTFIMFHGVIGTPFDVNQNEYGNLTLWEQIDDEEQFTPTKKFLTAVPIFLFLISTHYTNYDIFLFFITLTTTVVSVFPKLPQMHRVRLFGINKGFSD